ncbi:hypothetical protein HDU88_005038 [Geranomyces variabilis]|nr:hypothetical protein HDU88_005038 [Geranomyces variabilis]
MEGGEEGQAENGMRPSSSGMTKQLRGLSGRRTCWITVGIKLAAFSVLLTLASVGVMGLVSWLTTRDLLTSQLTVRMDTIALLRRQHVAETILNYFSDLDLISSRVLIQGFLRQVNNRETLRVAALAQGNGDLQSAVASYKGLLFAAFLAANGTTVFSTPVPAGDSILSQLISDATSVTKPTIINPAQRADGSFAWGLLAPVMDSNSPLIQLGSIYMVLATSELQQIVNDTAGLGNTGQLAIVTAVNQSSFHVVFPPVRTPNLFGQVLPLNRFYAINNAIATGKSGVMVGCGLLATETMTAYQPLPFNWVLIAEISQDEISAPISRLKLYILAAILVVGPATLVVSLLASQFIVRPIRRLRSLALLFSGGDFEVRSPIGHRRFPDELIELNMAFNIMAEKLSSQNDSLINKVKERTRELEAAKQEAEAANAAKSSFLATITHELRTPLNGICGLSALLAETPLNADQKDLIGSIRDCSEGLTIIVNDVLDFSKIEAGKLQLEVRAFDLHQSIEDSLYLLHLKASEKGLLLSHNIATDTPTYVEGDVVRLKQILINLVGNSVKFTSEGQVLVTVSSTRKDPGTFELFFEVKDTGIGIPNEAISRLFQSFSQVDSSTTRKFGGTGLGLAICKQLVEMMNGRIWVTSEPGKGSRFCFTIIANESRPAAIKQAPANEPMYSDLAQRYPLKILLAEDNAVNIKLAVRMLSRLGYTCTVVGNGEEAVNAMKEEHHDLILMDMQMPVCNGPEATQRIRTDRSITNQPVIVALTANAMATDRQKCLDSGMNDHLSKPIKIETLADAIELWYGSSYQCRHNGPACKLQDVRRVDSQDAFNPGEQHIIEQSNVTAPSMAYVYYIFWS